MRSGRETVDAAGASWQEAGLEPLGAARRGTAATPDLSTMPPELDLTYAPEQLRLAVEKYYRASGPESAELKKFLDGVYRPYYGGFKLYATVGRGPGYHARNTIGGVWNNWLRGVTVQDHELSMKLESARKQSWVRARREEAESIAASAGVTVDEALDRVAVGRVTDRADMLLSDALSGVQVGEGLSLYDVHRLGMVQEVGWKDSRVFEGVHDLMRRQSADATGATGEAVDPRFWQVNRKGSAWGANAEPRVQMFRDTDLADLNVAQRAANRAADNWWIDLSKDWAATSENFVRNAAFIRGLREYGTADGGGSAALLSRALHFDYQDLSDFERTWMRGTFIPFYTWARNNVPLQVRALMKEPGKMHRLTMANDAAADVWGDDEYDVVPEWMREKLGWVSRFSYAGSPIVIGVESPATDLNRFIKVGRPRDVAGGVRRQALNSLSPAVAIPVEQMMGVNAFTGAPFNPSGVPAPWWYQAIPFAPRHTDARGQVRAPEGFVSALTDAIPPLGQVERLVPLTPQSRERWATSVGSTLFAAPTSTLSARQEAGELRGRSDRLTARLKWDADPELVARATEMLEAGLSPVQVRALLTQ
jgi:hypothetical protein